MQANGREESSGGVAKQRVWKALLRSEGCVGLGRIVRETVEVEAGGRQGRVVVPERARLLGACEVIISMDIRVNVMNKCALELTSRGRRLGVGEQDNAALALLDELRESRFGTVMRLYLAAESCEIDGIANFGRADRRARRRGGGFGFRAIGLAFDGILDSFDGFGHGSFRLFDCSLRLLLGLLGLRSGLLFGRAHWSRRGRLALAQFDGHDDFWGRNAIAKLECSGISVANR